MLKTFIKPALSVAIVAAAIAGLSWKYRDYLANPWTRDGMVRAQVLQIAPRISGPIVDLPVRDNQRVAKGDLLFEIDPRTFQAAYDQALADLDRTRDDIEALKAQVSAATALVDQSRSQIGQAETAIAGYQAQFDQAFAELQRITVLVERQDVSRAVFDQRKADSDVAEARLRNAQERLVEANAALAQAEADLVRAQADLGAPGEQNARLRAARAAAETARLDLEFTKVIAPVDGYIANLQLRFGDQTVANQPALALIDSETFYVQGFFRETFVGRIGIGDRAVVTLMSYPDQPLGGRVDSIGWGIAPDDGTTGFELLPEVSPTFEWIRLAQRVPVRVHLDELPEGVALRVGTTASVLVMTGSAGSESSSSVPPLPRALQ
jgi:multidrug resistance efflux pump